MKTLKLLLSTAFLAVTVMASAQALIVDENFQSFAEQGWKGDSICGSKKIDSKSEFSVNKTYNGVKVEYSFLKCGIAPACDAKKTPANTGITTGYVEVSKKGGEFVISQLKYISTIEVGVSATGGNRGFMLYKSVKGGEWVKVGDYVGGKEAQGGFLSTIAINESDVSLKLVPAETENKEGKVEPQTFRVHNIKIWGK